MKYSIQPEHSAHELFMTKLRAVVDITASTVGDAYFKSLAEELSKAFDVEYVLISEAINNFKTIRTIAFWSNGELVPNIEYKSVNTPCGQVHKNEITFYPSDLKHYFPTDHYITDLKAVSYLGMPFYDTDGKALGLVCLLGTRPMDKNIYDEYLLKIITARVSAEFIRRKAEKQLRHLATHDALTDVPNKMLFWDRINTAIARAGRSGDKLGLLFIDLDNFKKINDSQGHHNGDLFLVEICNRLKHSCRKTDTLCRFGGDEFVVILEDIKDPNDLSQMADTLHHKIADSDITINDLGLHAEISIGAAIYPDHGSSSNELLQHADQAMYQAKKSNQAYQIYSEKELISH